MKSKVNKIVEMINKEKIIFNNIIDINVDKFGKEYIVIINMIDKSVVLDGINDKFNCELAKGLLGTLKVLSMQEDFPKDIKESFNHYFELDEEFASMILIQISINAIMLDGLEEIS